VVTLAPGATLAGLAAELDHRYGPGFAAVRGTARMWVNGDEPALGPETVLVADDEVAVLPPVSGGSGGSTPVGQSPGSDGPSARD